MHSSTFCFGNQTRKLGGWCIYSNGVGNAVPNLISSSDRLAPGNKEKQLQTNNEEENEWHIEKLGYLDIFDLLDRYKLYMILFFFFSHF